MRFKMDKRPSGWLCRFYQQGCDIIDKGCIVGRINSDFSISFFLAKPDPDTGESVYRVNRHFIGFESAKDWIRRNWDVISSDINLRYEKEL